ncbi:MAG: hypothetical protein ACI9FG_000819 [Crocinitomicaceae bacterium]|jgi:hypothetical protein
MGYFATPRLSRLKKTRLFLEVSVPLQVDIREI